MAAFLLSTCLFWNSQITCWTLTNCNEKQTLVFVIVNSFTPFSLLYAPLSLLNLLSPILQLFPTTHASISLFQKNLLTVSLRDFIAPTNSETPLLIQDTFHVLIVPLVGPLQPGHNASYVGWGRVVGPWRTRRILSWGNKHSWNWGTCLIESPLERAESQRPKAFEVTS